jgi:polar amino acid transport system substrate-binding protein
MLKLPRRITLLLAAATVALSFAAVACGDDDDDEEEATPTRAATAAPTAAGTSAATPSGEIDISAIEELTDGTLTIGSDIAYAPIEFLDEATNEPVGLDIDLANAIGEVLGVEVVFENSAFDGLLPALDAERYDIIMSAMTASEERKQQVDFVEYFNAGSGIIVAAGNPNAVASVEDLCGLRVAMQEGTVQVDYLEGTAEDPGGQSQACVDAGEEAITVLKFPSDPEAVQALLAGQAEAEMADYPVAAYSASQNEGEIEIITGYQFDAAPYGIAVRKSSTELRDALQAALDQLIDNGTYGEVLAEWDLEAGAITD